jgi:3-hydroxyacyl-[acyl-carrier-protein] dehydratase
MTATAHEVPVHDIVPGFDRMPLFEPGHRAVAVRNIPATLPHFATHFPRLPVLPGVLLLEDMTALAGAVVGPGEALRLRSVRGVRFRHSVGPGDQVEITAEVRGPADGGTACRATARVGGRVVATAATLLFAPVAGP